MGSITIVGLGPGRPGLLTMEVWELLKSAGKLIIRTGKHPTVAAVVEQGIEFTTYDDLYEKAESFEALYEDIANDVIAKAQAGADIVYAVPGSPLVAERTVVLIREKLAGRAEPALEIIPGMSFAEVMYSRLGIDPIDGLTIIDAMDLSRLPEEWPTGLIVTQIYDGMTASEAKLSLMELLPDDYEVVYTHNLGLEDESIRRIPLYELDRQPDIDHLTSLYVPPLKKPAVFELNPLVEVMKTLRSPGGCPWDIAQTHESLRRNLIEECYEVIEAIEAKDSHGLCEELGDLLMQIVFHARMAEEAGFFDMQEVIDGITEKLIRRHPHVFGEVSVADAAEVLVNWEEIKKQEKPERKSAIDGIPIQLPALIYAEKVQHKAAKVGFDWDEIGPVWDKCAEEIAELKEAVAEKDADHIEDEFGDLVFAIVNLARFLKVDPELALRRANKKFSRRFRVVEKKVIDSGREWSEYTLPELDKFWEEAKRMERGETL
ncbi:MAG: nucleoside triphosphate pyrophosphohydrolase [Selenomonadaceae bacterium]|nr:nucleoside triphosphate pyrophosphohydrolase [Selenomonadaceae bacterium]